MHVSAEGSGIRDKLEIVFPFPGSRICPLFSQGTLEIEFSYKKLEKYGKSSPWKFHFAPPHIEGH